MVTNKSIIFLFLSLFVSGGFLEGGAQGYSSEEVKIKAHFWEKKDNRISATGNVEIIYKDISLSADSAEVDTETKDVHAWGSVTLSSPEENMSCEEAYFNLDSGRGEMKTVFGMIQPIILYQAESVTRENQDFYGLEKAKVTTCAQPVPRWQFSCSRANLKKDEYMEMWNAVFKIKKVPIFYLPYIRYPLNKRRSTGFLMPQGGYSGQKGLFYSQSYFWAIKRNMDATFDLDYYLNRGLGSGLEYRYLFSEGTGGQFNLYYFLFNERAPEGSPENAYIIRFKHNQSLPADFSIVADIDYQSSYDFLREFDNDFKRAVVSNRRSQVYLSRAWSYFNLNMRVSRFETYYKQLDDSIIRKDLPQIGFGSTQIKLISPLYFSFTSLFDSWEYGWESQYEKGQQRESRSLGFTPSITIPFTSIPWITLNSSFSTKLNYYFNSYAPGTKTVVDEPILSHNYAVNLEFTGPVFSKIFYGAEGNPKLKHIIEPIFSYRYESPVALSERIITQRFFYINHYARYGLTNRFIVKQNNMTRDICTITFDQIYYFDPENSPLSNFRIDGKPPRFSDINGYFRFYPSTKYSLDFSLSFNPYNKKLSQMRLSARMGSINDPAFLNVNWYKSVNPYLEEARLARHQIGVYGGIKIPRLGLEAQVEMDFNILEKEMLYSALALVYHYQCIDFKGELKIFYFRDKPETQFRFSFGLGNIGRTTDFLGGIGF